MAQSEQKRERARASDKLAQGKECSLSVRPGLVYATVGNFIINSIYPLWAAECRQANERMLCGQMLSSVYFSPGKVNCAILKCVNRSLSARLSRWVLVREIWRSRGL